MLTAESLNMENGQTANAGRTWLRASALMLLLSLCACATSYRAMKNGQGYSDNQIAPDRFILTFQGNGQTSANQASDFAMLRAAQLTVQQGFSYFAVTDITNSSSARTYIARQQFYSDYPPGMGLPPPSLFAFQPYQPGYIAQYEWPAVYFRPGQRLWIQCFKTRPEKPFTYDAAALGQSLKAKYRLRFGKSRGITRRLAAACRRERMDPHLGAGNKTVGIKARQSVK